ncbi:hybrid sensor histidine kinase/response regulator [Isoalcanivorax indicus]|uniref:hybrid sensor histidine kinase/response regulator n=1 Tax=Isoalcanivorax indicus TaxID=2202653 RepID=UPI0013C4CED5|nr:PAS domain-containing sensor histidine kinase [Isoalcanivorax indicus]
MMRPPESKGRPGAERIWALALLAVALLVVLAERLTALGFAHGLLYAPLVYASGLLVRRAGFQWLITLLCVVLIWIGAGLSPGLADGFSMAHVLANRIAATVLVLVVGGFALYAIRERQQHARRSMSDRNRLRHFEAQAESLPVHVWSADGQGRIVHVGQRMAALTGHSVRYIADHWLEMVHPDDREQVAQAWQRAVARGTPYHMEFRLRRADGRYEWHLNEASPVFNERGEVERWFGSSTDVTHVQMLRHNTEQLRLLRSAVARVNDIILILDGGPVTEDSPRIVFANEAHERLSGLRNDQVVGRSPWETRGPPGQAEKLAAIRRAMAAGESVRTQLLAYVHDGSELTLDVDVVPVRDSDGVLTHWVVVARDVTEQAQIYRQLQNAQRLEAVGRLTGGIAHDFNNLLTVVLGNADLLGSVPGISAEARELIAVIQSAAERGSALTQRLLAFARRQALSPQVINVAQLVNPMAPILRSSLTDRSHLDIHVADETWPLCVDPAQLESALLNLALNAADAMPDGGRFSIDVSNVVLDADYALTHPEVKPGDYVCLAVADTGTGMPTSIQDRIFEPFFTTKAQGKGSGLGLSMVFGFIKQSGGHVSVDSAPGHGTRFRLYLPRATGEQARQAAPVARAPASGMTARVLVVEDDTSIRMLSVRYLRSAGYAVQEAASADEALVRIENGLVPDLLFTDIIMPGRHSGLTLAQACRSRWPRLPVLFTSGYAEADDAPDMAMEQIGPLLPKPFRREALLEQVAALLSAGGHSRGGDQ